MNFNLHFLAPDVPNFLGLYAIIDGTDYSQQTSGVNAIDDETIMFIESRRIVCYEQPIYQDLRLEGDEWLGLTLGVDRSSAFTLTQPMYDQAAILIRDDNSRFLYSTPLRHTLVWLVTTKHCLSRYLSRLWHMNT